MLEASNALTLLRHRRVPIAAIRDAGSTCTSMQESPVSLTLIMELES
jgi:hypothetical protein